jgi:hypothetical protein
MPLFCLFLLPPSLGGLLPSLASNGLLSGGRGCGTKAAVPRSIPAPKIICSSDVVQKQQSHAQFLHQNLYVVPAAFPRPIPAAKKMFYGISTFSSCSICTLILAAVPRLVPAAFPHSISASFPRYFLQHFHVSSCSISAFNFCSISTLILAAVPHLVPAAFAR